MSSAVAALLCTALGCDTAKSDETKTKAASVAAPEKGSTPAAAKAAPAKPAPAAEAKAEVAAAPVEMTEFDLSSADPTWAGWTAKGPANAKVMQDGVKGARIAADGRDGFDIAFAPKRTDLAKLKENLQIGAKASEGKLELAFTTDTADLLEWTSTGYGTTKYNFVMHFKAGDREVSCKNNYMVGMSSAEARTQHQEACKTLAKK